SFLWVVGIRPLNAPDEPAHLQAVMQVRKQHILPEIYFDFSKSTEQEVVLTPGDPAVRDYAAQNGISYTTTPYESRQPPLYYLGAAAFYVWFRGLRRPSYDPWLLRAGALLGLALLAKLTALALIPGLAVVLLARMFQTQGWAARLRRGLRLGLGASAAALAV